MNKLYGLTILAHPDFSEKEVAERIKDLLESKDYKIEYEGKKRLAYTVEGQEYAHYFYLDLGLTPLEVNLLPEKLNRLDWCLRHLLVVKPSRAERVKGIIKSYIIDTLEREKLDTIDIEGLAYKIDNELGE